MADGKKIRPGEQKLRPSDDPWPRSAAPDLRDVRVAIARTMPEYAGQPAVHEIEVLYGDCLCRCAARRHVYIETQYLTSRTVSDCIAARRGGRGPRH